ncbi:MAG: alpha/beta hydrolase [Hyphomicrobiales bacterium]|nr:alpha/beta hydrolase [Hyphomicrobiales bacterium]
MRFEINGNQVFASTGGRNPKPGQQWIIFVHGAGASHVVWSQQVRSFAYNGFNVLAVDLPGHAESIGEPYENVEEICDWLVSVMDFLNIDEAHLVNHSMGGLISLELAAKNPHRVKSVVFIATAMEIPVNDVLIEVSKTNPPKAYDMMHSGFFGRYGQMHDCSVPGTSLLGSSFQIMHHNPETALNTDLIICASYKGGAMAASKILCPTLCLLAGDDAMVRLKSGLMLADALSDSQLHIFEGAGHTLMGEVPREINQQMRSFYEENFDEK